MSSSLKARPRGGDGLFPERIEVYCLGRFHAMASPCEVLVDTEDRNEAGWCLRTAAREAWRIEQKFSRYRPDSIVARINTSGGKAIQVHGQVIPADVTILPAEERDAETQFGVRRP